MVIVFPTTILQTKILRATLNTAISKTKVGGGGGAKRRIKSQRLGAKFISNSRLETLGARAPTARADITVRLRDESGLSARMDRLPAFWDLSFFFLFP